jgi:hypothetical protein
MCTRRNLVMRSACMSALSSVLRVSAIYLSAAGVAYGDWLQQGEELIQGLSGSQSTKSTLSLDQIGSGLKEALRLGTETVVNQLGQKGGFATDPAVHIPLPESLEVVKTTLEKVGMGSQLSDLELKLNRAAEAAASKVKPLFWDAIGQMTLKDVNTIYHGPDDAATQYFRDKMSGRLTAEMSPIINHSLSQVGAVEAYDEVMADYRGLPFVPDVKADLTDHVTTRTEDGIFHYLAQQEAAIRKDPAKQTTELLKKVFGQD